MAQELKIWVWNLGIPQEWKPLWLPGLDINATWEQVNTHPVLDTGDVWTVESTAETQAIRVAEIRDQKGYLCVILINKYDQK